MRIDPSPGLWGSEWTHRSGRCGCNATNPGSNFQTQIKDILYFAFPVKLRNCECYKTALMVRQYSQLALRRWPNVNPYVGPTSAHQRWANVDLSIGPTLAQRSRANVGPTLCQHRPNVGALTLGQRWHNVTPMVVCQLCTNIGPTEAALLAFC